MNHATKLICNGTISFKPKNTNAINIAVGIKPEIPNDKLILQNS